MIWNERDGQRHVGHPGGLPGFGTLMRWVPELGLTAILLANVTYAQCRQPGAARARAGRARGRAAAPRRARRSGAAGRARRGRRPRRALGRRGGRRGCSRRNVDLDQPLSERRAELAALRERHGALVRDGELEPEDALRGSWRLRGERGHVDLEITLAPTVPPLVQTLDVDSVLPPSGPLAALATTAAALASEPDAAALVALLAPGRRRGRGAARVARRRGALRPVRRRRARSPATARRRPRCACRASAATSTSSSSSTPRAGASRASSWPRRLVSPGPRFIQCARRAPSRPGEQYAAQKRLITAASAIDQRPASNEPVTSRSAPSASGASAPMQ